MTWKSAHTAPCSSKSASTTGRVLVPPVVPRTVPDRVVCVWSRRDDGQRMYIVDEDVDGCFFQDDEVWWGGEGTSQVSRTFSKALSFSAIRAPLRWFSAFSCSTLPPASLPGSALPHTPHDTHTHTRHLTEQHALTAARSRRSC
eukprot:3457757-Rhodomonas_salina.2